MAGWLRNTAAYLGLVEEPEGHDAAPAAQPASASRSEYRSATLSRVPLHEVEAPAAPVAALVPMTAEISRIVTLHPRSYNDARRIGEEYREGTPVIINLTDMDDSDAKRIVDFAAGLVFGVYGSIEKITSKVFLLSPANVDVGAEARAQMRADGFYNQS